MIQIQNYINGKFEDASHGATIPVLDPADGLQYATAPDSGHDAVDRAIEAAEAAFPAWSSTSANARSAVLSKLADMIEERVEEWALAESRDNGKPIKLARAVDIPRASDNFRFFAHAATQFASESHHMPWAINYTLRRPLGVVGCISPWNLPIYLLTWKIAPALAAGNTVVAKPSEVTPMTAYLLSQLCDEAGLPPGVLNIVHGLGHSAGNALTRSPRVKAISFTGSTRVGKSIAEIVAPSFRKLSLEMGGKNPNIIFADCDYDKMINTTVHSSFSNQGQICLCGSRIYVERPIYERFKSDLVERAEALTVGHPSHPDTRVGAVVSRAHHQKILDCIELAKREGGKILTGGHAVHPDGYADGYYIAPTVIEGLDDQCRTNQEEIFGPVVTIAPFDTEDEVLASANSTDYGLSATIWTQDVTKAHRLAEQVESGIIWVNTWLRRDLRTPFGGMKSSGVGREGGFEAMKFFTEPKNVCIQY